jgi:shikimate dehydrogenase
MRKTSSIKNAFVCGHPITHSRSPLIHGSWLRDYNIEGSYETIDVAPEDFASFLKSIRAGDFIGGNITIPHKEAAFKLADHKDETATLIGAVNTLWMEAGQLNATNTDAYGFAANLDERAEDWDKATSALVIGAGGASRAIIHALKTRGFTDIRIANRTLTRAIELRDRFGNGISAHTLDAINELASDVSLIVNTTSLGMKGEGDIPLNFAKVQPEALVTDIVYVPLITPFLEAAANAGFKTADGLGMLLHQAVPGFEKWFGIRPVVGSTLRDFIIADMAKPK